MNSIALQAAGLAHMLRFDSVGMRYADGTVALKTVSLHIPHGEFCVVLGASGAGKSTLLRMANGLANPTSGTVHVDDVHVAEIGRAHV